MPYQAFIQAPGQVWQLSAEVLKTALKRGGVAAQRSLLFVQTLLTQIVQTAVCNRHHALEQHLARWLLMMFDRLDGGRLQLTQEVIATMLGVRRETVTKAALVLQGARLISYARDRIHLLNRGGWKPDRASAMAWSSVSTSACSIDPLPQPWNKKASAVNVCWFSGRTLSYLRSSVVLWLSGDLYRAAL